MTRPVPTSVLSDLFESLVAAMYLDGGIEPVRALVARMLEPEILKVASGEQGLNHKSLLQLYTQERRLGTPIYEVLDAQGQGHTSDVVLALAPLALPPAPPSPAWPLRRSCAPLRARKLWMAWPAAISLAIEFLSTITH